jgi:hypothetical protein
MISDGTIYTIIGLILSLWAVGVLWIAYEIWRAPVYDHNGFTIIKPRKTIKDLFRWKKK